MERQSFWNFNLGHAITIATMISGGTAAWAINQASVSQLRKDIDILSIKFEQMDERGTRASQKGIYQESEISKLTIKRVDSIETMLHEINPKLERIDVNLSWLLKSQGIEKKSDD